jgi:NitT/TauT family transport system substrate-binding protein
MAKRTQVTPAQLLEAFQGLRQPSIADNQALLSQKDPTLVSSMHKLIDVMITNRLIDRKIDPSTLLDDRFVRGAARRNHQ